MSIHKTTGERLRQARQAKNMTLKSVGKRLNLDPSAISKYETGKRHPSVDTLKHFAALYQISFETLVGENGRVSNDIRTYRVPWPYVRPIKRSIKILFAMYWMITLSYGLVDVSVPILRAYQLLAIPLMGSILLLKIFLEERLMPSQPEKMFELSADEELVFEHPASEAAIQSIRRRDFFGYILTLLIMFMITGFAVSSLDDQGVMMVSVTLFLANFIVFLSLMVMVLLKYTMQKRLLYDQTNRLTNRLKYRLHFIVATGSSAFHFFIYPDVRDALSNALASILVYALLVLYAMITMHHAFEKHDFFRRYTITKN
ncbi:MAG: XRE family transcriptional regulator [Acholeplasmatales bacterium]|nr:MAG: XRE family transcriptional regulator [Acholeplasmatales bacterium]